MSRPAIVERLFADDRDWECLNESERAGVRAYIEGLERDAALLDEVRAAAEFRKKVRDAGKRGEDTTSNGAFRDAIQWLESAAMATLDAGVAMKGVTP